MMALVVTPAFAEGKGSNPNGKPFIELQGQIIEVEGEVSTLQDQVDSLVGQVDSIEAKAQANSDAIAALQAQSADLQAQIDANADDILSLQLQVNGLEAENAALQAQIDELGDADGALQAQIDANFAMITTLNQTIADLGINLQDQIDNNTALIGVMQGEIDAIEELLALKQNIVDGYCPDGSAIREILSDGSVVCEQVGGGGPGTVAVTYTSKSGTALAGQFLHLNASCPSGYTAIGGGYSFYYQVPVYRSQPHHSYVRWRCSARNLMTWDLPMVCWAVCSQVQ
jgi:hypothetical protein